MSRLLRQWRLANADALHFHARVLLFGITWMSVRIPLHRGQVTACSVVLEYLIAECLNINSRQATPYGSRLQRRNTGNCSPVDGTSTSTTCTDFSCKNKRDSDRTTPLKREKKTENEQKGQSVAKYPCHLLLKIVRGTVSNIQPNPLGLFYWPSRQPTISLKDANVPNGRCQFEGHHPFRECAKSGTWIQPKILFRAHPYQTINESYNRILLFTPS